VLSIGIGGRLTDSSRHSSSHSAPHKTTAAALPLDTWLSMSIVWSEQRYTYRAENACFWSHFVLKPIDLQR
jgi:hypothetical protein